MRESGYVAPRALAVVGQKQKRNVEQPQHADELGGAGNQLASPVDHTIHVNQKTFTHKISHTSPPNKFPKNL